jgi:hypothetical protein
MILAGSSLEGQSQTSDTICAPVAQMKKVYAAALQKRVCDSMNVILEARINSLNNSIALLNQKDSVTVAGYEGQLKVFREEKALYQDQMKGFEKLVRREKRKRFFATAGGILTTGIVTYLAIKK